MRAGGEAPPGRRWARIVGTAIGRAARLWVVVLAAAAAAAAERVVAVGDVHGAYEQFVSILQHAGVIDKDMAWTGGKTVLIQTGDVLDRGPRSRDAMDLLMDMAAKAAPAGGEVRALLGNHETMVMIGDLRYVAAEEYQAFAGPESDKLREAEYKEYLLYRKQRSVKARRPVPGESAHDKKAWMEIHPPGFFEFRQAFAPAGKYGKWLRTHDAVTQVDDVLFMHGGLSPELRQKNIKEINDQIRKDLETIDKAWSKLCSRGILWQYLSLEEAQNEARADFMAQQNSGGAVDPDLMTFMNLGNLTMAAPTGPLWFRGYAQEQEAAFAPHLEKVLKKFKVRTLVVGHTIPSAKRITPRFDGRVFLIDTGMLPGSFQGRASALEIAGGQFRSLYVGEPAQALSANGK